MSIDGSWDVIMKTPMGDQQGKLTLKSDGDALTGTMAAMAGEVDIRDGKDDNGSLSWSADITSPMPMTLEFTATIDGDGNISGDVQLGAFGTSSFSGTPA